ncbi:MAG: hypothetical protein K2X38_16385 [Gemmataceae bacterium]|nr:hypothetical protein [Gemmataceae bacterium]
MKARACLVGFVLFAIGCDNHLKVIDDNERAMSELTSVLRRVRDEASMKSAEPQLEAIAAKMEALAERGRKLGEPSSGLREQLDQRMERLDATRRSLVEETQRVLALPGGEKLFEKLKSIKPGI